MAKSRAQNIGSVKSNGTGFEGTLELLAFTGEIVITPVTDAKDGQDAPDFEVSTVRPNGSLFRIGSARNKIAKSSKKKYVTVLIDQFQITAEPIFANLVEDNNEQGKLNILV